jgi:uncharacterized protein RhaS with RHS repeats
MRYYDPTFGRWTQRDPLDQFADPQEANRYAYARHDPINRIDPTGAISIDGLAEGVQNCTAGGLTGFASGFVIGGLGSRSVQGAVVGGIVGGASGCALGVLQVEDRVEGFLEDVNPFD